MPVRPIADQIFNHVKSMPESEQIEVLDFVEYLEHKTKELRIRAEEKEWFNFSLCSGMRGLKEEPDDYRLDDLKETF